MNSNLVKELDNTVFTPNLLLNLSSEQSISEDITNNEDDLLLNGSDIADLIVIDPDTNETITSLQTKRDNDRCKITYTSIIKSNIRNITFAFYNREKLELKKMVSNLYLSSKFTEAVLKTRMCVLQYMQQLYNIKLSNDEINILLYSNSIYPKFNLVSKNINYIISHEANNIYKKIFDTMFSECNPLSIATNGKYNNIENTNLPDSMKNTILLLIVCSVLNIKTRVDDSGYITVEMNYPDLKTTVDFHIVEGNIEKSDFDVALIKIDYNNNELPFIHSNIYSDNRICIGSSYRLIDNIQYNVNYKVTSIAKSFFSNAFNNDLTYSYITAIMYGNSIITKLGAY